MFSPQMSKHEPWAKNEIGSEPKLWHQILESAIHPHQNFKRNLWGNSTLGPRWGFTKLNLNRWIHHQIRIEKKRAVCNIEPKKSKNWNEMERIHRNAPQLKQPQTKPEKTWTTMMLFTLASSSSSRCSRPASARPKGANRFPRRCVQCFDSCYHHRYETDSHIILFFLFYIGVAW